MARAKTAARQDAPQDDPDVVMVGGMEPEHEEVVEVQVELPAKEQEQEAQDIKDEAEDAYGEETLGYDEEEQPRDRSRRQARNQSRKERLKRAAQLEKENEELRARLGDVDALKRAYGALANGHIGLTTRSIDTELAGHQQTLSLAKSEFERLINLPPEERPRGEIQRVMDLRDEAAFKVNELTQAKNRLAAGGQPDPRQQQQQRQPQQQRRPEPQADPKTEHFASVFEDRHPWYDPEGNDEDSDIVRTLGARLEAEGYLPNTPQLWRELEKRVRARGLGSTNNGGDGEDDEEQEERRPAQRRGLPPTGAIRNSGQPGKVTMTLNKMQRDILEEEGLAGPSYDGLRGEEKKQADERRARYIAKWRDGFKKLQRTNA